MSQAASLTERLAAKAPEWTGVLLLLGLLIWFLLWPAFQNVRDSLVASDWPTTEGVVTKSKTVTNHNGDGKISRTRMFIYEYRIDGHTYRGRRYSLVSPSGNPGGGIERFKEGEAIQVHFDPQHPKRSVIDVESSAWWNYLILVAVLSGGSLYLFMSLRSVFDRSPMRPSR